jgi:hypothetical protein
VFYFRIFSNFDLLEATCCTIFKRSEELQKGEQTDSFTQPLPLAATTGVARVCPGVGLDGQEGDNIKPTAIVPSLVDSNDLIER